MYFFIHTPRTGGTTLESIIQKNQFPKDICNLYPQDNSFVFPDFEKKVRNSLLENLSGVEKLQGRFAIGHFTYGIHNLIHVDAFKYFATVRNPFQHVVSVYRAIKNLPIETQIQVTSRENIDFEDYVQLESYRNMQTFFISGLSVDEINQKPEEAINKCIQILDNHYCGFVITEYFDESLLILNKELKFNNLRYKSINKNSEPFQLPAHYRTLISEKNSADMLLYQEILKRVQKKSNACFQIKSNFLKWLNKI